MTGLSDVRRDTRSYQHEPSTQMPGFMNSYIDKCVPSFPKITVCNNTDGVSELVLNIWWHRNHEPNQLRLDRNNFILRKLVVAIFVLGPYNQLGKSNFQCLQETYSPFTLDKIFKVKSASKPCNCSIIICSDNLEKRNRKAWFLFFFGNDPLR